MESIPLEPADRAILDLECETIVGHTCKIVLLGADAPDLQPLRERVAAGLDAAPELTRRLGGAPDAPAWVPDRDFDLEWHVRGLVHEPPLEREAVLAQVAELFGQRLNRSRPLWRIDVVPRPAGGSALIWRIHHALADGTASMRFAKALLWDAVAADADAANATAKAMRPLAAGHPDEVRRRRHLAGFIDREFGESMRRSPFDGAIGSRRRVAFAVVPLRELHDASKQLAGATLNDAVLSVVAGALRRWIQHHHGSLGSVRVKVPVSLHHEGDAAANRDSFFSLPLPLNEPDPVRRLQLVNEATTVRKRGQDAEQLDRLLQELTGVSPRLGGFLERIERSPRRFAVNVSNVPGPREPVSVLGSPVEGMHSIAEIGLRHGLRISAVSLADNLYFGFCADPALVDDLDQMSTGVEAEAEALIHAG